MKRIISLAVIATLISVSCKVTPPPATYIPTFNFSPPTTSKSALSSTVKVILLHPVYAPGFRSSQEQLFANFSESMAKNFEEMINARGYAFKGPFRTYDELIFKDKSEMDMCLQPEIDIRFTWEQGALHSAFNYLTKANDYWIDGNCTISGSINLKASETTTQMKVWNPTIPLTPHTFHVTTYHRYITANIPLSDPNYYNATGKALELVYAEAMKIAWNKLDPDELKNVKEDCDKIKSKKTY